MAAYKIEKPVTLTIAQEDGETLRYSTPHLTFHMNNSRYDELTATGLTKLSYEPPKEAPVPTETPATPESGLTNEQKFQLDAVINAAKGIERQKFMNARAIDAAIREAEKLTADAEHKFNMAVLQTLHTGLTSLTIDAKLEDTGFGEFTEKTDYIGALDTAMLYASEA